jgi:photosystem II stability/assembly factor-like uncharacterized protein
VSGSPGITVERASVPGDSYLPIAILPGSATAFTDTTAGYNTQYVYEVFSGDPRGVATPDADMALSLPPTSGSDDTAGAAAGTAFSPDNLTAMEGAADSTYTTANNWGATVTLAGGAEPDWMSCISASTCWLYTDVGNIWATTNGGESWIPETTPSNPVWYGGQFINASDGWAVGNRGTIVSTADGGTTWTVQASGITQILSAISCVSSSQCWAAGHRGVIIATTNGGTTWAAQTSGTIDNFYAMDCPSATACWAVGANGIVIATTNSGTTWTAQTSGTSQDLTAISCVSSTHCWAVGFGGVIIATSNSGTTWAGQTSGTTQELAATSCVSSTQCWAAGLGGVIIATTDGGTTWAAQTSGTADDIWGLECISDVQCWAYGSTSTGANGVVLLTTTGGSTWFSPASNQYLQWTFTPTVVSEAPVTAAVLTLVDDASETPSAGTVPYVLVSTDRGSTWIPFSIANPNTSMTIQTFSLGSIISRGAAISGLEIRYVVTGGNGFESTFHLVHVDIN